MNANHNSIYRRSVRTLLSLAMAVILSLMAVVPANAASVNFTDVSKSSPFYDGIVFCAEKGIVNGYSATQFGPSDPVTRKQFMIMLSRAFYSNETAALNTPANTKSDRFAPNYMALQRAGILDGSSFVNNYLDAGVIGQRINRYDMAQLMTNIMSKKGFAATQAQMSLVPYEVTDFKSVPAQYKNAVKNVYGLGIITGYADGTFGGNKNMTRGAGATVIYRMMKYAPAETPVETPEIPETPKPENPERPATPSTPPTGTSTITVYNNKDANGNTAWYSCNNNYPDGYLNNGEPITQENILKLLNTAKSQWPTGMSWSDRKDITNVYGFYDAYKSTKSTWVLSPIVSTRYNPCGPSR